MYKVVNSKGNLELIATRLKDVETFFKPSETDHEKYTVYDKDGNVVIIQSTEK